jgi:hypothetical protein
MLPEKYIHIKDDVVVVQKKTSSFRFSAVDELNVSPHKKDVVTGGYYPPYFFRGKFKMSRIFIDVFIIAMEGLLMGSRLAFSFLFHSR